MKELLKGFLIEFQNCSTEDQLSIFQELKQVFKNQLTEKGEKTEKELMYLKDVFKSQFPEQ